MSDASEHDEPHRIRLRDWDVFSANERIVLRRHFHRPTNLDDCVVHVRIDGPAPQSVTINSVPLPCTQCSDTTTKWQIDVEELGAHNQIECTYSSLSTTPQVCLEISPSPHRD